MLSITGRKNCWMRIAGARGSPTTRLRRPIWFSNSTARRHSTSSAWARTSGSDCALKALRSMPGEDGQWKELAKAESIGACHLWRVRPTTTRRRCGSESPNRRSARLCRILACSMSPNFRGLGSADRGDPDATESANGKWSPRRTPTPTAALATRSTPIHQRSGTRTARTASIISRNRLSSIMGEATTVTGFTYLPRQDGTPHGMVDRYEFYLSQDGKDWGAAASSRGICQYPEQSDFADNHAAAARRGALLQVRRNPRRGVGPRGDRRVGHSQ